MGFLLFYIYFLLFIGMGIVQPLAAIIRLLGERRRDSKYALGLKRYLVSVILYFFILHFLVSFFPDNLYDFKTFYVLVLPWFLAIYYMHHVYSWKRKRKNIKAFDKLQLLNAPHEDRLLLDTYPKKQIKLEHLITPKNKAKSKKAIIRKLPILELAK